MRNRDRWGDGFFLRGFFHELQVLPQNTLQKVNIYSVSVTFHRQVVSLLGQCLASNDTSVTFLISLGISLQIRLQKYVRLIFGAGVNIYDLRHIPFFQHENFIMNFLRYIWVRDFPTNSC